MPAIPKGLDSKGFAYFCTYRLLSTRQRNTVYSCCLIQASSNAIWMMHIAHLGEKLRHNWGRIKNYCKHVQATRGCRQKYVSPVYGTPSRVQVLIATLDNFPDTCTSTSSKPWTTSPHIYSDFVKYQVPGTGYCVSSKTTLQPYQYLGKRTLQ